MRAAGLVEKTSITAGTGRGLFVWNGTLYAVIGQHLYSINAHHGGSSLGTIQGTSRCTFGANAAQMLICAPPHAYVLEAGVVTEVTDSDFLTPAMGGSVDGYAVFIEAGSDKFYSSDLDAFTSYDALYYASAEGQPGNLVGLIVDHRQVILAKSDSMEMWENVGGSGFPFSRAVNGFMEIGCAAGETLAKADNSVFMLANDLTVRRLEGLTWVRKSQAGVEQAIRSYDISGAYAFSYTQDGHVFYCLTFPVPGASWLYDVTTNEWHERSSNGGQWRPVAAVECYGRSYYQRYDTGAVGYFDPDVYTDCGDRMIVEWTYGPTYKDNKRLFHSCLECVLETGIGTDSDNTGNSYIYGYFGSGPTVSSGTDPQILLSMSNDGGREWVALPTKSLGAEGERQTRVRWHGLGSSRERVYKMSVTDPVKVVVTDTQLDVH
jgi:hypothetical protein